MADDQTQQVVEEPTATVDTPAVSDTQQSVTDPTATIAGTAVTSEPTVEEKTADEQASTDQPVSYDFTNVIPENFEFSEDEQSKFVEVIKDMKLSNEQASAIAKYGMDWCQGIVNGIAEQIVAERKGWAETAKQELGNEFESSVKLCGTAIEHIEKTVPGIRQALNETGAGNRVEIIKAFSLLGQLISGDPGMVQQTGVTGADGVKGGFASRYPNTDFKKYY